MEIELAKSEQKPAVSKQTAFCLAGQSGLPSIHARDAGASRPAGAERAILRTN